MGFDEANATGGIVGILLIVVLVLANDRQNMNMKIRFYNVPAEFHVATGNRYAIVNDHPVTVEPRSRRIVHTFSPKA
jgi:hypothetical protein